MFRCIIIKILLKSVIILVLCYVTIAYLVLLVGIVISFLFHPNYLRIYINNSRFVSFFRCKNG